MFCAVLDIMCFLMFCHVFLWCIAFCVLYGITVQHSLLCCIVVYYFVVYHVLCNVVFFVVRWVLCVRCSV